MAETPADRNIYDLPLRELTPAELHARGIDKLSNALNRQDARDQADLATTAQALFFAALSADNLAASARTAERKGGAHRSDPNIPVDPAWREPAGEPA